MKQYLLPVVCFVFFAPFIGIASAFEFGDPEKFAVRFNDETGNLSEIVYKGEVVTVPKEPGTEPAQSPEQRFDILQEDQWVFGKAGGKLELIEIATGKHLGSSIVHVVQKIGDWKITTRYSVDVQTATLGRNIELEYDPPSPSNSKPTKIKGFWMSLPFFPFGDESRFFVPGTYPPKSFTPDDFAVGAKQGIWRDSAPLVFQLDKTKSVLLLSDPLNSYSDRPSGDVYRQKEGLRLVQSFDTKGFVRPGLMSRQFIGPAYLRIVDGDAEEALLKMHDFRRHLGHVVPKDRPDWFESAILYSFHPGGTIGSNFKDLGGFVPATKHLDRIKELGCNAIWLLPLEDKSVYWPRDYYKFQDGLGSTPEKAGEEYKALVDRAHELGLKVLQDNVPHGGSNTYQRMIDHPEWLAQDEDGSTLHYWCADFNWPTWIEYMAGVSTHYMKTYGIDGYRVDACGGSRIPNWNPAIPYNRASFSQSQGGLNMLRGIRKAVKDEKADGAILAEVGGGIFGAVSDAVYDFDLCYHVLHDARKETPEVFVNRLRRWLHEQQYSEIPDLLRLRHVESHDSLRGQLWYGTEPHRALVALTAFIHGMPLVYHEQEIGHFYRFQHLFDVRKKVPELNGGDVDYLCVDAPPGVFACLRKKGDDACIVLINFNETETTEPFAVNWNRLPKPMQDLKSLHLVDAGQKRYLVVAKQEEQLIQNWTLKPFAWHVLAIRKEGVPKIADFKTEIFVEDAEPRLCVDLENEKFLRFEMQSHVLWIDSDTGLLTCLDKNGDRIVVDADLLLPGEWDNKAEKPTVTTKNAATSNKVESVSIDRRFENSQLCVSYREISSHGNNFCLWVGCQWKGKTAPNHYALMLSLTDRRHWGATTCDGVLQDSFYLRHLSAKKMDSPIYWRSQGTNVVFDSLLNPAEYVQFNGSDNPKSDCVAIEVVPRDVRIRILDRVADKKGLVSLLSCEGNDASYQEIGVVISTKVLHLPPRKNVNWIPTIGGWIFENDYFKLRLTRSGTIMSLDQKSDPKSRERSTNDIKSRKRSEAEFPGGTDEKAGQPGNSAEYRSVSGSLIRRSDLYTDYGYGEQGKRYGAENDVEAGCRIVQDEDGILRLRFEGQLRGFGRFDLMRPPVEYFIEYALKDDSPAFSMACGIKTHRVATDNRAFLSSIFTMPQVERFEYFKDGQTLAEGSNVDAKGRSFQAGTNLPDRVLLKDAEKTLLELVEISGDASNLFLDHKNFFIAFDDGDAVSMPNRWRTFSATIYCGERSEDFVAPKISAITDRSSQVISGRGSKSGFQEENGLLVDGGFEAISSGDLVSLRAGAVLKGRPSDSAWQTPEHGAISRDVFRNGKSAARVDGEIAQYRLFSQDIASQYLKPGTRLRLSAWVKGKDIVQGPENWQAGCVRFAAQVGGNMNYGTAANLTGTFDWKPVFVEYTVPENLQKLTVQVGSNGAAGTIWIDDVVLEFCEQ